MKPIRELNAIKITIVAAFLSATSYTNAAPINELIITGGSFIFSTGGGTLNPAAFSSMSVDGLNYDGSVPATSGSEASYASTSIVTAQFSTSENDFGSIAVFTSDSDQVSSGFPATTGDITDSILTLDLSAWTMFWNGSYFNMGSSSDLVDGSVCVTVTATNCSTAITTTYDAATGGFTATWNAVTVGGCCNGHLSTWNITGTVSAVPVPAAVWLFGSGLIGLAGIARRKKIYKI